jgi:large subunit ribosomal protein L12
MEYIYAAMLLHKAGKKVEEGSVKKVLEAANVKVDESRVKALVAALDGVNIDEAIQKAQAVQVAAAPVAEATKESKGAEKKAEKEEEKVSEEEASAGLGALFG